MTLMSHVNEMGDSTGMPTHILDATYDGLPLYLKNGFKQIDTLRYEYQGMVEDFAVLYKEPQRR